MHGLNVQKTKDKKKKNKDKNKMIITIKRQARPKRTSIGKSKNTRPLNKHKRKCWKKYRGQGK